MQLTSAPRRRLELVEGSAVALCAVLLLALTARLSGAPWSPAAVIAVAGGLAAGYLAADLASGLVHWFCDRFFEEDSPLIGAVLIHPFREHHRDPLAMTRHGVLELTGNACLGLVPILSVAWWGGAPADGALGVFAYGVLLAAALGTFATNLFHGWAHAPGVPVPVAWLQRRGLILSARAHAAHHHRGEGAYCVTVGWMNGWTDRLGVFARLERALRAAGVPAARSRG